jgi:outer membrane receptor protein involved in Fe transport
VDEIVREVSFVKGTGSSVPLTKRPPRTFFLAAAFVVAALHAGAQQSTTPQTIPPVTQSITVTADRGLEDINDSATSTALLSQQQLEQAPGLALDDSLHSVAGFQLFRRTSSWTANPTSQGLSLRGLGSTGASRTLVVSDQTPLTDPFGGWVHWNETPTLAIQQVQLLRGGSADLYGSSAIGGVIDVVPVEPLPGYVFNFSADASGATENTGVGDALLTSATHFLDTLAAFSMVDNGGYITTAPALRGSVDIPTNVISESGRLELRTPAELHGVSAFLRGNVMNEARINGTPMQTNAARLWRYVGGADSDSTLGHGVLRLYGSREGYRQGFSSVAADRNSEKLTKLQRVPTDEFGFALQGSRALPRAVTAALGLDLRDIRGTDDETGVVNSLPTTTTSTSARQRETGGYVDAVWQPRNWSLSGSVRVDSFRTFDAQQRVSNSPVTTPLPEIDELVASPRLGLVRQLPHGIALTATAFRAFRGPTLNELYRTSQVGQQTTLANSSLLAERATGFEFGGNLTLGHLGTLRSTYFWTEVNRPISAVQLSQTATTQTLQRQNLGQIRSRGLMLEAQSEHWHGFDATFGYQLAVATVTAFNSNSPEQNNLTGKWIPEVPRESVTATANYAAPHVANFHLIASYTGQEFDDAENQFLLHPEARFDLSADRSLSHGLSIFAGAQNLLNRSIDAGRTPILTLAAPRLVQAGLRYNFSR